MDIRFLFVFLALLRGRGAVCSGLWRGSPDDAVPAVHVWPSACFCYLSVDLYYPDFFPCDPLSQSGAAKKLIFPGTIYLAFCLCAIWISPDLPTGQLKLGFGVFLMLLALFSSAAAEN